MAWKDQQRTPNRNGFFIIVANNKNNLLPRVKSQLNLLCYHPTTKVNYSMDGQKNRGTAGDNGSGGYLLQQLVLVVKVTVTTLVE